MSPEFGATCAIFPVDDEALRYLRLTGRPEAQVQLVEDYFKEQELFHHAGSPECEYTDVLELELSTVVPSVAGPKRPQDRLLLTTASDNFKSTFASQLTEGVGTPDGVRHGAVVIASITSCTNTSNPSVMTAAGLLAKKAVEKGLTTKPWVKTSLAPGSRVASDILEKAGLLDYLNELRFNVVGYGCMTCIGNSGPLPEEISKQINEENLVVCSVLSGNRNFEGRINQDIKANYLMSPPLVVAYALAGTIEIDLSTEPLGTGSDGQPVYLKDIWPTQAEIAETNHKAVRKELYIDNYEDVFKGDERWAEISVTGGDNFSWRDESTYIKNPPYFNGMSLQAPEAVADLTGMRALAVLGDSITTDHISPAGNIKASSPAGKYLSERGVPTAMFNSYGSRRGHDEVMVRGTFANVRLKNQLAPGTEGGFTTYLPTGEVTTIYEASMDYQKAGTPLLILAGKEYGSGSSRDWAAKGTMMLGVKAVLAQSFERIHRSNLIGMGVVPLEFTNGASIESLGLTGHESFDLAGLSAAVASGFADGKILKLTATSPEGKVTELEVKVRIDTPQENLYYLNGGILQYVLRSLV